MNNETARNPRPPAKTAGRVPTQNARTDNKRDFPLCGRFLLALAFWVGMRPAVFLPVGAVFITAVHSGWVRVPLFLPAGAILRSPAAAYFILFSFCFPGPRFYYFRVVRLHLDSNLHVRRPSVCFEGVTCEP